MSSRPTWDEYFLSLATLAATRSKDPRTKVGCVIVRDRRVVGTGYNGFPKGVKDGIEERWEVPEKYIWVSHAEQNAIAMAARDGVALKDSIFYITLPPCVECAKLIIQCGASVLVIGNPAPSHWTSYNLDKSAKMFEESGIKVIFGESYGYRRVL